MSTIKKVRSKAETPTTDGSVQEQLQGIVAEFLTSPKRRPLPDLKAFVSQKPIRSLAQYANTRMMYHNTVTWHGQSPSERGRLVNFVINGDQARVC